MQKLGLLLFVIALAIFTLLPGLGTFSLNSDSLKTNTQYHQQEILAIAKQDGVLNKEYSSNIAYIKDLKSVLKKAQTALNEKAQNGLPEGVSEWDYKLGDWNVKDYVLNTVKASANGPVQSNWLWMFLLTFGLAILGGLLFILPKFRDLPGIKNDHIYTASATRGLEHPIRNGILYLTIAATLLYGVFYMNSDFFWSVLTLLIIGLIAYLVFKKQGHSALNPPKSASPSATGWIGIISGAYLIGFYVLLYWAPHYITSWISLVDPISMKLSGNPASQWFLYGFLYTIIVLVMGIRMISKYRHNKYQIVRTISVIFFQTAFAFLIPEILVGLNYPYFDFKNIWPLNYTFFFDYNLSSLMASGKLGIFMLVWGIALILIAVPVITYFYGKRWYCSWVCGCGGLAETMGDPYRQLSDKSLRAWSIERYSIHAVLVFAFIMTILVLYSFFSGSDSVLFISSGSVRAWYGFLIGSAFAGIIGTGFYPLMGNRMWCRFGCPLAAYIGLVQKFKSRFRITTNGGQCISCGNCSTYCEMGIDVRWYAQRGQDIVRSSCVGCGVCSAVCPRGVLRLENASSDIGSRAQELRTIHISENDVKILA